MAANLKDNIGPVKEQLTDVAKDAAAELKGPAQEAVQSVKQTATGAAETVSPRDSLQPEMCRARRSNPKQRFRTAKTERLPPQCDLLRAAGRPDRERGYRSICS